MTPAPEISVLIPTFNRREDLLRCLRALERQTFPLERFEVVVADSSTDGTAEAVAEFHAGSRLAISCHHLGRAGPGPARNLAAEHARGAILAFTDDDVVPPPDWLERGARHFARPEIAGIEGVTLLHGSQAPVLSFGGERQLGFMTCTLFLRRDVFFQIGGFDPAFDHPQPGLYFREDADLGFRLIEAGYRIEVAGDVVVTHRELFPTATGCFRHARRYYFDPLLYRRHPGAYRRMIEVKRLGPLRVHRPVHYLCWFYLLDALFLVGACFAGNAPAIGAAVVMALPVWSALLYRYGRRWLPDPRHPLRSLALLLLPFHYCWWFVRGCVRFRSWGALV